MYEGNVARGLPHHPATICAFDEETGVLRAVLDATELTAVRTAGAAALSIALAARRDARVAAVIGTGPVAAAHLEVLTAVRDFDELRVAARTAAGAERLAARYDAVAVADIETAVRGADVVCLCTSATSSVLRRDWLAEGVHITSVGYAPPGGELDPWLARTGRLLVESRDAFAPPPAGCAELAGIDPQSAAELGEIVIGTRPGRERDDELTVYKSMGSVIEDVAAAGVVLRACRGPRHGHPAGALARAGRRPGSARRRSRARRASRRRGRPAASPRRRRPRRPRRRGRPRGRPP